MYGYNLIDSVSYTYIFVLKYVLHRYVLITCQEDNGNRTHCLLLAINIGFKILFFLYIL